MPTKVVTPRADQRLVDGTQLLLRFNDDARPEQALSNALRDSGLYKMVPGYPYGAITVSVLTVESIVEARVLTAGIGRHWFGLASVGHLRQLGYVVVATDIEIDGSREAFSDRHVDVIVCGYPDDEPLYADTVPPAERRRIRSGLLPLYTRALRAFDPRYEVPEEV